MFLSPKLIIQVISWIAILGLVGSSIYLLVVNFQALQYSPDNVVQRFQALIENPTQTVTDVEKQDLQDITQPGFFASWQNENNIKTLRRVSQQNPITHTVITYTGASKKYATTSLVFQNTLTNPNSKQAKLYLEQYGTWYTSGYRWRIYQIDMPQEDNILNNVQQQAGDVQKNVEQGTQNAWDKIRGFFGGN